MFILSITIALLGLLFPTIVNSHMHGAPVEACSYLNPGHGVTDQMVPSPYLIKPSQTSYRCGETIKVSVTSNDGSKIRGFLCQARTDQFDYTTIVGFLNADSHNSTTMNHVCGLGHGLTHTNNTDKEAIKMTWSADQPHGPVTFICTIVKEKVKFWTRLVSEPVQYVEGGECVSAANHVTLSSWIVTFIICGSLMNQIVNG